MLPRGQDSIGGLLPSMNIRDIVRASVAHYMHQGFENRLNNMTEFLEGKDTSTPRGFDMATAKQTADESNRYHMSEIIRRSGGPLVGLFSIPIARCDGGECISGGEYTGWPKMDGKMKTTKGLKIKNFPCMVGAYDTWRPAGEPPNRKVSCSQCLCPSIARLLEFASRSIRMFRKASSRQQIWSMTTLSGAHATPISNTIVMMRATKIPDFTSTKRNMVKRRRRGGHGSLATTITKVENIVVIQ